jgi:hypothetical protein
MGPGGMVGTVHTDSFAEDGCGRICGPSSGEKRREKVTVLAACYGFRRYGVRGAADGPRLENWDFPIFGHLRG